MGGEGGVFHFFQGDVWGGRWRYVTGILPARLWVVSGHKYWLSRRIALA